MSWDFFWERQVQDLQDQSPNHWIVQVLVKGLIHMGVSKNNGTPKSSILIGFSLINHPFWGTPIFGNIHIVPFVQKDPHMLPTVTKPLDKLPPNIQVALTNENGGSTVSPSNVRFARIVRLGRALRGIRVMRLLRQLKTISEGWKVGGFKVGWVETNEWGRLTEQLVKQKKHTQHPDL